jgi:hypothetical protein
MNEVSANAGERSVIIYTIIESCRRRGIEPYTYLLQVLTPCRTLPHLTVDSVPFTPCRNS